VLGLAPIIKTHLVRIVHKTTAKGLGLMGLMLCGALARAVETHISIFRLRPVSSVRDFRT